MIEVSLEEVTKDPLARYQGFFISEGILHLKTDSGRVIAFCDYTDQGYSMCVSEYTEAHPYEYSGKERLVDVTILARDFTTISGRPTWRQLVKFKK